MTQRERQASGGVVAVDPPAPAEAVPRHSDPSALTAGGRLPLWEDVYQTASPSQRRELLALASRQGLLYNHQLPAFADSTGAQAQQVLARLLTGRVDGLEPLHAEPVAVGDADLDVVQREAVARALRTPDICLVQGLPGTGKSRVTAEVVTQAAARGERVLLVAPTAAALDHLLEVLTGREQVWPVRCLAPDETLATLSPAARALTFDEQVRTLRETTLARGRAEAEACAARCARRRQEGSLWENLQELAAGHCRLIEQKAHVEEAQTRLTAQLEEETARLVKGDVEAPVYPFTTALRDLVRERDEAIAQVNAQENKRAARQAAKETEGAALADELAALRPLADAKREGRWWTSAWWHATLKGTAPARAQEVQDQLEQLRGVLAAIGHEQETLAAEKQRIHEKFQSDRDRLLAAEVARRQAEIADQQTAVREEERLLLDKAQSLGRALESLAPAQLLAPEAVAAAHDRWRLLVQEDEEQSVFAHHWVHCLEELGDSLPERLRGLVNVVAATTAGLAGDLHSGNGSAPDRPFDRLVLEEADRITEVEFAAAARRARCWVLIGEPENPGAAADDLELPEPREEVRRGHHGRSRGSNRPGPRVPALRVGFFHRLWQALHCDPRRLPYAWSQENDRLCCRLRPVGPEQRQWVETESVADRPEVELRILTVPEHAPQLAEVLFPAGMSICQAKEYIYKELQELPIRTAGHSLRWAEEPDRLVLHLADVPLSNRLPVSLEPGVREMVGHLPCGEAANGQGTNGSRARVPEWFTCCVEFERAAGWQSERAHRWVEERLGLRDLGRTVRLDRAHRMRPELAAFVADLLWGEQAAMAAAGLPGSTRAPTPAVEFVPVPPLPRPRPERPRGRSEQARPPQGASSGPSLPRNGAGIELDIADSRHRDRLPAELRNTLPDRGLVNYLEAQAILRALHGLATGPDGRKPTRVGVVALYASQAELIRRLVANDSIIRQSGLAVVVDIPSACRHCEFDTVLVSLTRSHSSRAVGFGDGPSALALALTRARHRLLVFGDVGGVVRRAQWEGQVDSLDETSSLRERALAHRLTRYFHGQGPYPAGFRLHEGSSP